MPSRLTDLVVVENTLCRAGANPGARVVLFKRLDGVKTGSVEKVIKLEDGKYNVYSEDGAKHLGGPYATKDEAVTRLKQIEGHKKMRKVKKPADVVPAETRKDLGSYVQPELAPYADDEENETAPSTFGEELMERRARDVMCDVAELVGALGDAVRSVIEHADPADVKDLIASALGDFGDSVLSAVDDWSGDLTKFKKIGAKIAQERLGRLKGAHQMLGSMIQEQDSNYHPGGQLPPGDTKETGMPTDAEKKAADEAAAAAEAKKKKDAATKDEPAAMAKALESPEAKAIFQKMVDDTLAPIKKENEDLRKAVDDERSKREDVEVGSIVDKDLVGYPGSRDEKVATVKSIRKSLAKEDADKAIDQMRKAAAAVRQSDTFREIGSDAGGGAAGGTPLQQLDGIAKAMLAEVRKSGGDLTPAVAFTKACEQNPDIYNRYMTEQMRRPQ